MRPAATGERVHGRSRLRPRRAADACRPRGAADAGQSRVHRRRDWQTPPSVAPFSASDRASAALLRQADGIGDTAATTTVYVTVVVLTLVGVAFVVLAVWLVRSTRPEPELFAPLELMDDRRWRRLDPQDRRRSLDDARPAGASPLRRPQRPPEVDDDFGRPPPVRSLDDLAVGAASTGPTGGAEGTDPSDGATVDRAAVDRPAVGDAHGGSEDDTSDHLRPDDAPAVDRHPSDGDDAPWSEPPSDRVDDERPSDAV